jgi:ubiquinone/menaquinone biosynthesis C-methylase UbiE
MQHTAHRHTPLQTEGFAHPHTNVGLFGLEHGMHVADFGSGSGHYVLAIAEWLAGSGHVYAIDVQRDLLKRTQNEATKRGLKNVSVIWTDLERTRSSKIADHHLDVVLISNLLFQLQYKEEVFLEAHRILKTIGKLIIIDWSDSWGGMGPTKDDVVKKEMALALARENGFELLREFPAGAHHYGLILRPAHHVFKNKK